jgi:hypothetical protein
VIDRKGIIRAANADPDYKRLLPAPTELQTFGATQLLLAAFGARWLGSLAQSPSRNQLSRAVCGVALGMCVVLGLKGSSQDCDIEGKPDFENAGAAQ